MRGGFPISFAVVSRMDAVTLFDGGSSKSKSRRSKGSWRVDYLPLKVAIGDYIRPGRLLELSLASHAETVRFMLGAIDLVRRNLEVLPRPDFERGRLGETLLACRTTAQVEVGASGHAAPTEAHALYRRGQRSSTLVASGL